MPLAVDLLHPSLREEKRRCKLKRLVPSPNSFFMDVKCPDCIQPCSDPGCLSRLRSCALPTHRRTNAISERYRKKTR
ncbi:Zinc-binding ribosomal protein family protein [Paragonimus heterotremus]|uniref:Zinc-binding ribosomal protein family protein n=1 Tax=Paragonimus heterotremus TaxID=100268 RepID=A0A8J4SXW9_9TREM|nr:Zinc-binding ribosomal protein family protein [Paragonimus heterotremus]